jgi:hypothetical protein
LPKPSAFEKIPKTFLKKSTRETSVEDAARKLENNLTKPGISYQPEDKK